MSAMWVLVPGCATFLLKIKQFPFSCRLVKWFTFLKIAQNQFKTLLKMSIVLASIVPTERNANSWCLEGCVTTPRSIYACRKCGAWLFAHKVPFVLQENVKTTETDKTRFFFARKRWTWYPTNNCYIMSHFNQPNIERKNCVWTTKYKSLLEMCIVHHVETKSVFTHQPIKWLNSTTVKSEKACCNVLNNTFKDQKPTVILSGGDDTHCFARKTSHNYKKEKPSPFLKKFLRQSQPSTSEPQPKKG